MAMERPTDDEIARVERWFAARFNNRGWQLAEQPSRTAAELRELLYVAYGAAVHWDAVGNEVHAARAELLLTRAHALNGDSARATHYAQNAFAFISGALTGYVAEPWELAFAHAALAEAAATSGDAGTHRRYYASAEALGDALPDAEDRAIFRATFDRIPPPADPLTSTKTET